MMVGCMTAYHLLATPLIQCRTKVRQFPQIAKAHSKLARRFSPAPFCALTVTNINTSRENHGGERPHSQLAFSRSEGTEWPAFAASPQNSVPNDTDTRPQPQSQSKDDDHIFDEAYIRRTYKIPTNLDYPEIPEVVSENPKSVVIQTPRGTFKPRSVFLSTGSPGLFRCQVFVDIVGGEQISAIGEGFKKKAAEKAAYLHVVAQLHNKGLLKLAYVPKDTVITSDKALQVRHSVYDYAAQFLFVPRFCHSTAKSVLDQDGRQRYETIVELPEGDVKAEGVGLSFRDAETAACLKFLHETHPRGPASPKNPVALRTSNVYQFWEWYRFEHPEAELKMDGPSRVGNDGLLRAQVLMDGKPLGEAVQLFGDVGEEDKIELLACMTAAVALQNHDASLLLRYLDATKNGGIHVPRSLSPTDILVDIESTIAMEDTVSRMPEPKLPDRNRDIASAVLGKERKNKRQRSWQAFERLALRRRLEELNKNPTHEQLRVKKAELPINHHRNEVIDMVEKNFFCILMGATGSGKTTQVPQIILEHAILNDIGPDCNIICTQPRRIAATSVAYRVASERGEPLQRTVGYQVRMNSKLPRQAGSITYCTTGVLLARLQDDLDDTFDNYTHLIIDEVHERDVQLDFLLVLLKTAIQERLVQGKRVPKVMLMSATIDAGLLARYFQKSLPSGKMIHCPTLSVPGRLFPVTEKHFGDIWHSLQRDYCGQLGFVYSDSDTKEYIEYESQPLDAQSPLAKLVRWEESGATRRNDTATSSLAQKGSPPSVYANISMGERLETFVPTRLAAAVVAHLARTTDEGAILTFLPGFEEILKVDQILRMESPLAVNFQDPSKFKIVLLHSRISIADQSEVFDSVPQGCRKIILATNIAETSVTIPDVRYVIDTGKMREKHYDPIQRITKLQCTWISKSNSKQRAGRAGRVRDGHYYALFSKARLGTMRATGLPELLRSDLEGVCLDIKAQSLRVPIAEFLAGAVEAPPPQAVTFAIRSLQKLEALTDSEQLTPLGRLLATLPVSPAIGKMIILGVVFRCLDAMMILAAAAQGPPIYFTPLGQKREVSKVRRAFSQESGSDHIALLNAYRAMRNTAAQEGDVAAKQMAERWFINYSSFKSIEATTYEIEKILVDAGLIPNTTPTDRYNTQLGDPPLNETSSKIPLIKALLTAGSPTNLATAISPLRLQTKSVNLPTLVHPTSVKGVSSGKEESRFTRHDLLTYNTMVKSHDGKCLFLREVSQISPLTAALFGGHLRPKPGLDSAYKTLELNEWLPLFVKGAHNAPQVLLQYRAALDQLLSSTFQDLSSRRRRNRAADEEDEEEQAQRGEYGKEYLADEPLRAFFVDGVVDLLDRDAARMNQEIKIPNAAAVEIAAMLSSKTTTTTTVTTI